MGGDSTHEEFQARWEGIWSGGLTVGQVSARDVAPGCRPLVRCDRRVLSACVELRLPVGRLAERTSDGSVL